MERDATHRAPAVAHLQESEHGGKEEQHPAQQAEERHHLVVTPHRQLPPQDPSTKSSPNAQQQGNSTGSAAPQQQQEPVNQVVTQISSVLDQLKSKYRLERKELVNTLGDQIRDVKIECLTLRSTQMDSERKLDSVQRRLTAYETNVANAADTTNSADGIGSANEKLKALNSSVTHTETELNVLKQTLLCDRMRLEERQRETDIEDEHLEDRLKNIEQSSDELAVELSRTREAAQAVNRAAETLAVDCRADFATVSGAKEASAALHNVKKELEEVRAQNSVMMSRIETIASFAEGTERERDAQLGRLEKALRESELQNSAAESTAPLLLPADSSNPGTESYRPHGEMQGQTMNPGVGGTFIARTGSADTNPQGNGPSTFTHQYPVRPPPMTSSEGLPQMSPSPFIPTAGPTGLTAGYRPARTSVPSSSVYPAERLTLRHLVTEFYRTYNPSKLVLLDRILIEYEGADDELMTALEAQYGVQGVFDALIKRTIGW